MFVVHLEEERNIVELISEITNLLMARLEEASVTARRAVVLERWVVVHRPVNLDGDSAIAQFVKHHLLLLGALVIGIDQDVDMNHGILIYMLFLF